MPTSITKANLIGQFRIDVNPAPFILPALPALTTTVASGESINTSGGTTLSITIPAGVFSISGVCIGGGGGGGGTYGGGGGGGLYHMSDQTVYPGNVISLVVGAAGGTTTGGGQSRIGFPNGTYIFGNGGTYNAGTTSTTTLPTVGTSASVGVSGTLPGPGLNYGSYGGAGIGGYAQRYNASGRDQGGGFTGYYYGGGGGGGAAGAYSQYGGTSYGRGANAQKPYTGDRDITSASIGAGGGQGGVMADGGGSSLYGGGAGAYGYNTGVVAYNVVSALPGLSTATGSYSKTYGGGGGGGNAGSSGAARIVWPGSTYKFMTYINAVYNYPSVPTVSSVSWTPNSPRDMPGIVAWYDENSVSIDNNKWYDRMSNIGPATLVNCTLNLSANTNGANTRTFYAVTGGTTSSITWPADLFPSSANYPPYGGRYTIFHVTRYSGSNKQRIYSTTGTEDWASGHYAGNTSTFKHGSNLTVSSSANYGTYWFVTTDQLNIGRTNGVTRATGTGLTTYPSQLAINKYASDGINVTEKSDFQTACLIVCSGAMPNVYYSLLETWLRNNYGITT